MNIVILDSVTANPGDLSWDFLKKYGELTVYDRSPVDKIYERAKDAYLIIATGEKAIYANILLKKGVVK